MRSRTKWIVAGGAAAVVLAPITTVLGSAPVDDQPRSTGVVLDAEAANRARAARVTTEPAARPSSAPKATKKPTARATKKASKPTAEPTGKKTVSAASPVSSHSPISPVSPDTPG